MDRETWNEVSDKVLSRLLDAGEIDALQMGLLWKDGQRIAERDVDEARRRFLVWVHNKAVVCTACDRHSQRVVGTFGSGPLDAPMLIGSSPGYLETLVGRPFIGMAEALQSSWASEPEKLEKYFGLYVNRLEEPPDLSDPEGIVADIPESRPKEVNLPKAFTSADGNILPMVSAGQILDRILIDLNLSRVPWPKPSVYLTNSVLCPKVEDGKNISPGAKQKSACSVWLDVQIMLVDPSKIICLGADAWSCFGDAKDFSANVGKLITRVDDKPIGVTYHPGVLLHPNQNVSYEALRAHLKYFLKGEA